MLLRYVALHGRLPSTDAEWAEYRAWKQKQLGLAECHMQDPEGSPGEQCEGCPGKPGCPKLRSGA